MYNLKASITSGMDNAWLKNEQLVLSYVLVLLYICFFLKYNRILVLMKYLWQKI